MGHSNRQISESSPEALVRIFVEGVLLLEAKKELPPGEILRPEDLFGGTHQGFAKFLRSAERILIALEATYPGIYVLPSNAYLLRYELFEEMIGGEKAHMEILMTMNASFQFTRYCAEDSAQALLKSQRRGGEVLECLATSLDRLIKYHENFVTRLMETHSQPHVSEDWNAMFLLKDEILRATTMGALRSYCVHYLAAVEFLDDRLSYELNDHLSEPLHRVLDHQRWLTDVLELTSPAGRDIHDALCLALYKTSEITESINEMGLQMRSIQSARSLERRINSWDSLGLDADSLGSLLLDDLLLTDASSGIMHHSVFLFESILLCCQNVSTHDSLDMHAYAPVYPIAQWEFGPAMNGLITMDVLFSVPVNCLRSLHRVSAGTFEIDWEEQGIMHTHVFTAIFEAQCDQWCSSLMALMPSVQTPLDIDIGPLLAEHFSDADADWDDSQSDDLQGPLDLTGKVSREGKYPCAHGGFADVWKGGNVRWAAPELFQVPDDGSVPTVNTHSDVYSYGSVTLEILSGNVPFSYLLRDAQVVMEVFKGVKPRRPATPFMTNALWDFISQCWRDEPQARPDAEELLKSMHGFLKGNRRNTS
ncbi:hypothetical protein HWV62_8092 [Athelia sp. TMB]|nr:hypothetical protein HWV62_8092 [Athelia sp. TMB]